MDKLPSHVKRHIVKYVRQRSITEDDSLPTSAAQALLDKNLLDESVRIRRKKNLAKLGPTPALGGNNDLPPDILAKIAAASDVATKAMLNVASKATTTKISLSDFKALAKIIAKHFVLHMIIDNSIYFNMVVKGEDIAYRRVDIDGDLITIYDFRPLTKKALNDITVTENRSTQNLLVHAAVCYYAKDNIALIESKSAGTFEQIGVSLPTKREWSNLATYLLKIIEHNYSSEDTMMMEVYRSDIAPSSRSPTTPTTRTAATARNTVSVHAQRRAIINDGKDVLNAKYAKALLENKALDRAVEGRREKYLEQLKKLPQYGGKTRPTKKPNPTKI